MFDDTWTPEPRVDESLTREEMIKLCKTVKIGRVQGAIREKMRKLHQAEA